MCVQTSYLSIVHSLEANGQEEIKLVSVYRSQHKSGNLP